MSFPERLTLSHLIDGENDKDAVSTKEHHADLNYCSSLDASLPVGARAPAVVNGDAGKPVILTSLVVISMLVRYTVTQLIILFYFHSFSFSFGLNLCIFF